MIASRIADARAGLKARGRRGRRVAGAVPYGYDGDLRTKQLVVNPKEAPAVKWIFGAAAEGELPLVIATRRIRAGGSRRRGPLDGAPGHSHGSGTLFTSVCFAIATVFDPATTNGWLRRNCSIPRLNASYVEMDATAGHATRDRVAAEGLSAMCGTWAGYEPAYGPEGASRLRLLPAPANGWWAAALRQHRHDRGNSHRYGSNSAELVIRPKELRPGGNVPVSGAGLILRKIPSTENGCGPTSTGLYPRLRMS